jgi:hypothetical protein
MREMSGDLWAYAAANGVDAACVTTNGFCRRGRDGRPELVMGAGCALEAKRRWPDLPARLAALIGEHGHRCFRVRAAGFGPWLVALPTKPEHGPNGEPGFKVDSDLPLIERSCRELVEMTDKFGWEHVVLPRPGVGKGNLSWDDVRGTIAPLLDDRFAVISF